jgi:hypothetical protein
MRQAVEAHSRLADGNIPLPGTLVFSDKPFTKNLPVLARSYGNI